MPTHHSGDPGVGGAGGATAPTGGDAHHRETPTRPGTRGGRGCSAIVIVGLGLGQARVGMAARRCVWPPI